MCCTRSQRRGAGGPGRRDARAITGAAAWPRRAALDHADAVWRVSRPMTAAGGGRASRGPLPGADRINADGQAIRRPRTLEQLVAVTGADEARSQHRGRLPGRRCFFPAAVRQRAGARRRIDISHEALIRSGCASPTRRTAGWSASSEKDWSGDRCCPGRQLRRDRPTSFRGDHRGAGTWLRRRNAAWAERYGGGWAVVRLVEASVAARDRQMQRELEERTREERARAEAEQVALREEQARLRETTLHSELAAATEKGRRVRLFRWGMAAALLLFAFAAVAAWTARQQSTRANKEAAAARCGPGRAPRERPKVATATPGGRRGRRAEQSEVDDQGHRAGARQAPAGRIDGAGRQRPPAKPSPRPATSIAKGVNALRLAARLHPHRPASRSARAPAIWRGGSPAPASAMPPSWCQASNGRTTTDPAKFAASSADECQQLRPAAARRSSTASCPGRLCGCRT